MWRKKREVVIDRPMREASALLAIRNPSILEAHGWELGFWTCSDEAPVEEALGALGKKKGKDKWTVHRPGKVRARPRKKTEDCEALARQGDWIYLFGSQFGPKPGPLSPRRHFVARFDESRIQGKLGKAEIEMQVARGRFRLHRLINDALRESGVELIERGREEALREILKVRQEGRKKGKAWASRVEKEDWPINLEGAEFLERGSLLLGLRYPVTRDGHPVLVEVEGIEGLFEDPPREPRAAGVWVLGNVGTAEAPSGIRGIEKRGGEVHVLAGNLDSDPEESLILQEHPEGGKAGSCHYRLALDGQRGGTVRCEQVGSLDGETKVEGVALDLRGRFWYVLDDERIRLRAG